jgi:hypothetical protein
LSAPRPSTPSCAPPRVCASGQPAAGSRLDHRRFNGLLFLLRSAVSRKRLQPAPHKSVPVSSGRAGAGPLDLHAARRDGSGRSSPGGRDGRPLGHQAHARALDPEASARGNTRGREKGPAQALPSWAAYRPGCPDGRDSRRNAHCQLRLDQVVPARARCHHLGSAASSRWPRWCPCCAASEPRCHVLRHARSTRPRGPPLPSW